MKPRRLRAAVAVLACVAGLAGCERSSATTRELAALRGQVAALKLQAQAARDWTSIANLQANYGYYVDTMRWDDAADLFATNAILDMKGHGLVEGKDAIRTYLHSPEKLEYGALFNHMQQQPAIHIAPDGLTAESRWRAFIQTGRRGREARPAQVIYDNEYVKEEGAWKIYRLHGVITFQAAASRPPALD